MYIYIFFLITHLYNVTSTKFQQKQKTEVFIIYKETFTQNYLFQLKERGLIGVNGRAAQQIVGKAKKHGPEPAQIQFLQLNVQETALRPSHARLKTARLMADGVTMETGLSVLRNVEEDLSQEPGPAQILLLLTVETIVREKALRNRIATHLAARLMADGVTMESGQSVLRNVEEDLSQEPGPAQILLLLTVEKIVREKALRNRIATHLAARLMADGVTMETGLSVLRNVEEDLSQEPGPAQILLLLTVEKIVREKALRNRIATHLAARLTADGVTMETGLSVLRNVEEDLSQEPEPAQILLLLTVEKIVREKALRNRIATHLAARLMADGVTMETGLSVLRNVEEDLSQEPGPAKILLLLTVETIVREKPLRNRIATHLAARLMVDGVTMESGQSVLRNVEEDLSQEPGPAQILLLLTVEKVVREKALRNRIATHLAARLMADGVTMETGLSVLRNVEEDLSQEPGPAQILLLLTVEKIVREKALSNRIATHLAARLMVDGVTMESGLSVLRNVEEDLSQEPGPAQILLLLTVEMVVREKALRNRIATHLAARLMADGVTMETGLSVLRNVEEDLSQEPGPAQILLLLTMEKIVRKKALRNRIATHLAARLMADGVTMETGLNVLRNVEEDLSQEPGPAQILLLLTVEKIVREKALSNRIATHLAARLMVDGVTMESGLSVLRNVEEDLSQEPGPAQILLLLTVEMVVREKALRNRIATHLAARLMADGVTMETGLSVLRNVEEDLSQEPGPAQILLLLTMEKIVRKKALRNRIATHLAARLMADGVTMETGLNVLRNVEEDLSQEPGLAQILLLLTVEKIVREKALSNRIATHLAARLMADGVTMETGLSVLRNVEEDLSQEPGPAQILLLLTVEKIVREKALSNRIATHLAARLMADGVTMETGLSVLRNVEEDLSQEPGPAQILLLLTVETIVREKPLRNRIATHLAARLMADGVTMETGLSVLRNMEEDLSQEPGPAQILLLLTVETIVREKALRNRSATHLAARLMVDGVTMESGQSVLRNVEEDLSQEPGPAQILLLLTVEKIVREKPLSNRIATHLAARLMVDGVTMESGQSVLRNVEEDLSQEPGPAQILLLLTVEKIVREKALRNRIATHLAARLMADGVTMETGLNVLRNVEEDLSQEPGPAQILLLLTVEKVVREKALRNRIATHLVPG